MNDLLVEATCEKNKKVLSKNRSSHLSQVDPDATSEHEDMFLLDPNGLKILQHVALGLQPRPQQVVEHVGTPKPTPTTFSGHRSGP